MVDQAAVRTLNASLPRPLTTDAAWRLIQSKPASWAVLAREATVATRAAYEFRGKSQKIRSDVEEDLLAARRRMTQVLRQRQTTFRLPGSEVAAAFALATYAARYPNLVVNTEKTARARESVRKNVSAVYRNIAPGSVVVEAGTRIDSERWAELQDLDLVAPRFDINVALAKLALCIVLVAFYASYLASNHPRLVEQPASLWLAAMVPIIFVALFRCLLRIPHGDNSMVPIAATAAMLLTILLHARIGFICAFMVASLCALMARADSGLFLATALAACVGVMGVSEIASRSQLLRASVLLAVTNATLAMTLGTIRGTPMDELLSLSMWAAVAGAVTVGATVGLAMFLERPFGITTHLRLLELSTPDELVMRRMQAEAPGTYTHSLMVAMLSEAAAKAVGADPLLCRVGGLYHDIGKLRRPHCFIENQSGENVHDRLSPQLSALLIISHVKDGVELGRALRLPQPVLDIIAQHHGMTLIAYFYHRAAKSLRQQEAQLQETLPESTPEKPANTPDEELFRYPGPRPQSKEAAIVLLADTIEASSRALPNLTPERLEEHIKTMIEQRLKDGELSECELTLRDMATIEQTFAHVLRGVLHHRIEYPDPGKELKDAENARDWMDDALSDPLDNR
ncbi:MAG TPA: HDIG domain-containing protein, partial [Abditibacteriaceae bacterium]